MNRLFAIWVGFCLASQGAEPLRVMCWNIHHGVGIDGKLDLTRIAKVIEAASPDLVALQEVDHRCSRSAMVDQTAELARLTGMSGHFGPAMDFGGGQYGLAILSKHPVHATRVHPLPGDGEPRIAFVAEISRDGLRFQFTTLHLELTEETRIQQARHLTQNPGLSAPLLIAGDFNAPAESPSMRIFSAKWPLLAKAEPRFTHPADKPTDEIDHFLAKGFSSVEPVSVLPESLASDHRPIIVNLQPST